MISAIAILGAIARPKVSLHPDVDHDLLVRHRSGDPAAFAAIYRAHAVAVYRRLSRILGPVPEREDLTQEVFLALHKALPTFRGECRLTTIIHRIAINRAYDHLRHRSRRPTTLVDGSYFDDLIGPAVSPEHQSAARQDLARVFACLARIKPKKRIAFLLRVVDGLAFEEIAQLTDASSDAVAKRVQHAQRELDALMRSHA